MNVIQSIKKIYIIILLILSYILLIFSFFPVLRYYIISLSLIIMIHELVRLGKFKKFIDSFLNKKKDWDVRDSKILSISFYSLIICIFLYIILWLITTFLYLYPLSEELRSLIK